MSDSAADAVSLALAGLKTLAPKPTLDQVLDALEIVLGDRAWVSGDALGIRTLQIEDRPRERGSVPTALVELLRDSMPKVVASYRKKCERAPTLRELMYSIGFVLLASPEIYTSDATGELGDLLIGPAR
ncbi:MAG: hypothetical protein ABI678_08770 [Kofleriaceae bacterium]